MEYIVPIGIGVGVMLLLTLASSLRRKRELKLLSASVKQLRQDLDLAQAQLHQTKFIDLDLSSVEAKVEESSQQLQILVQQEVESLSRDMTELDERLTELESDQAADKSAGQLEDLEDRVSELEAAASLTNPHRPA